MTKAHTPQRDYIIVNKDNEPLRFNSDHSVVTYGTLADAQGDCDTAKGETIRQISTTIEGFVIKTRLDGEYNHTDAQFRPNGDETNRTLLPWGFLDRILNYEMDTEDATLAIRLLDEPTERHLKPSHNRPRLQGWVSRQTKTNWFHPNPLRFSIDKPKAEDGWFVDGSHYFDIDAQEFPHIAEMSDPVPAEIEIYVKGHGMLTDVKQTIR